MIENLSPKHVKKLLDSGEKIRLIDVREQWEYDIAKIENSELMPLSEFEKHAPLLQPGEKIILYCHHGVRSYSACAYLINQGHENVINLKGGINAWALEIDDTVPVY